MKTYKELLSEIKFVHNLFHKIDLKIAKKMHQNLQKNMVIRNDFKFGQEIKTTDINKHFAHSDEYAPHNFRDDIESYNSIITGKNK